MRLSYVGKIIEILEKVKTERKAEEGQLAQQQQFQKELTAIEESTQELLNIIKGLKKLLDKAIFLMEDEEEEIEKPLEEVIESFEDMHEDLLELMPKLNLVDKLLAIRPEEGVIAEVSFSSCPFCGIEVTPDAYSCGKCHAVLPKLKTGAETSAKSDVSVTDDSQEIPIQAGTLKLVIDVLEKLKEGVVPLEEFREKYPQMKKVLEDNIINFDLREMYQNEKALLAANAEKEIAEGTEVGEGEEERIIEAGNKIFNAFLEADLPFFQQCQNYLKEGLEIIDLFLESDDLEELTPAIERIKEATKAYEGFLHATDTAANNLTKELNEAKQQLKQA